MRFSRRAILGGTSLALARPLRAQSPPANADDGFQILEASKRIEQQQTIFSYQGTIPGPTIRIRQGEELRVRLINRLDQPTTLHWHGCPLPNAMDGAAGVTQDAIAPGATFDYRFNATDSGTYWYHPGTFAERTRQIAGGLFGPLIVEERNPPAVHRELLLTLHDAIVKDGSAQATSADGSSAQDQIAKDAESGAAAGQRLFINGAVPPLALTCAPGSRLRLRLINASAYRVAVIGFKGFKPTVVAIDGQPSDLFEPVHASVPLGPGARADIVADLAAEAHATARLVLHGDGDGDIAVIAIDGEAVAALPPVAPLAANPALPSGINLAKAKRLDLVTDASDSFKLVAAPGSKSVAAAATPGKPIFVAKRGTPVSLGFRNETSWVQVIHLHGHAMRLLHPLDDGWEPYWCDGFLLPPQKISRVAFVADKPGKWVVEATPLGSTGPLRYAFFDVT